MKLRNISKEDQTVLPHTGPAVSAPPGAEPDFADVCGAELLREFPEVWAPVDVVKPKKISKKED